MSSFQDLYVFRSQKPWGRIPKKLQVVGVERRSVCLFYADYT